MRIGIVGPIWLNIPPSGYGGTEEVVHNLVNGLVKKGHDVTLFAPATAKVPSKLVPTVNQPLREMNIGWDNIAYNILHISKGFEYASDFDILHVHLNKAQDYIALPLALYSKTPVMFTLHFKLPDTQNRNDRALVLKKYKYLPYTSISNSQRLPLDLNYVATVYNSIKVDQFTFNDKPEDYYAWLGKVNPIKGTKEAILAAKQAGVKLLVMGVVEKGVKELFDYYEKEVKPLIDNNKQIIWLGEVDLLKKIKVLSKAKAFLNPIQWEEPFGLVMAEAQAVGTPVISFRRGAAPELIIDGKTGYLADTFEDFVKKIHQVDKINRKDCRENVEQRFTIDVMTNGYIHAYEQVIQKWESFRAQQMNFIKNS